MVQKYDIHSKDGTWDDNYEMRAEQHGDYVLFEDHETALAIAESDFKVLQRDYQKLVDKIGDLYREA